ncbi:MAG: cobalamin biosynthesis protein CbiD [Butyrivibrio sp.]|uniref:cobalt-precorrin-5B (C(1))-methyltransferase CbiD n=1 Tax=Butyrivibrio sp. TaxID=28121 RepID=UPI001B0A0CB1|nr:cobalt-precorrin-5B (C(1))-methyltransferase CbiD [Butyrivibrio sp.]MBO6239634.1 cobalamin biosynthesis protein CbiD [Butyrivibrio sp.]
MRKGFTTGSCAAAASKAAALMLLGGNKKEKIEIDTPAGIKYCPVIEEISITENYVSCAVRKDSGDDPDVTNNALIFSKVSFSDREEPSEKACRIRITGGVGVGTVTRPGLDQKVGNAAINSVPRQMIEKEVLEVCDLFDYEGELDVEIFVPEGERIAERTFNPRLGIEGGISIIGTTGIVEPMSMKAILDTIRIELRQQKHLFAPVAVVSPGNYGLEFMKDTYGYDLDRAVKCSNFIGDTIDMAIELGFDKMLLCGHVGKLIKVSGGIMNTHSREADCRMELMAAAAAKAGAKTGDILDILNCVSTEEAVEVYLRAGIMEKSFDHIMDRIDFYLNKRAGFKMDVQCIVYSNQYGLLGKTKKAEEFLDKAKGVS